MAHVIPGSRNSHPLSRMGMFLVTWMEQQEMRGRGSDLYQLELYQSCVHVCCSFLHTTNSLHRLWGVRVYSRL